MSDDKGSLLLLEILRVGLIAIRNLACSQQLDTQARTMEKEWAYLCHSLPAILIGNGRPEAMRYFCNGDGKMFLKNYPRKEDADFKQIHSFLTELDKMVQPS